MATAMSFQLGAEEGLVRAGVFLMSQAIVYYLSSVFLFPKLLGRKKYLMYGVGVIIAIGLSGFIMHLGEVMFGFDPPFIKHGRGRGYHYHHSAVHAEHVKKYITFFKRGHIVGHFLASFATLFLMDDLLDQLRLLISN